MAGNEAIQQAVRLIREGERVKARDVLKDVLSKEKDNPFAWAAMVQVVDSREEALFCLKQVLKLKPGDAWALEAMDRLKEMPEKPKPEAARVSPFEGGDQPSAPAKPAVPAFTTSPVPSSGEGDQVQAAPTPDDVFAPDEAVASAPGPGKAAAPAPFTAAAPTLDDIFAPAAAEPALEEVAAPTLDELIASPAPEVEAKPSPFISSEGQLTPFQPVSTVGQPAREAVIAEVLGKKEPPPNWMPALITILWVVIGIILIAVVYFVWREFFASFPDDPERVLQAAQEWTEASYRSDYDTMEDLVCGRQSYQVQSARQQAGFFGMFGLNLGVTVNPPSTLTYEIIEIKGNQADVLVDGFYPELEAYDSSFSDEVVYHMRRELGRWRWCGESGASIDPGE